MFAVGALALAVALGALGGGSVRGLSAVELRFGGPALILFVVQAIARGRIMTTAGTKLGVAVWVLSCVVLVGLLWSDWRRAGVWVLCVGLATNVLVVLLNGGMPVSPSSHSSATEIAAAVVQDGTFYEIAGPDTLLGLLGDVVPLRAATYRVLVSPGDLLLAIGIAAFATSAMANPGDSPSTAGGA